MKDFKYSFFKSACTSRSVSGNTSFVLEWLQNQNERVKVHTERIALNEMTHWTFNQKLDTLQHVSGHFFSIDGIRITTNWGNKKTWDQPIINQPEIGYLGFICKNFNDVLHFLMQAKIEPGNINSVQLSPTIQATRSNYTQKHKGKKPLYLDYFKNVKPENVLLDQLQSEQGARFLMKRNRNIIIQVDGEIDLDDNFIWLTLGHIKKLMRYDNIINMDTRTVISGIHYEDLDTEKSDLSRFLVENKNTGGYSKELLNSILTIDGSINSINYIIHFLTKIKSKYDLFINKIPLRSVKQWNLSKIAISRSDGKYFKVIGVNVIISNREVTNWQQPMVEPSQSGICAFICKKINGVLHFIVQAKLECGNRDIIEFAPTVQCLTGDYRDIDASIVPFLDCVLEAPRKNILFDTLQSEEGGRFYHEENRNIIVLEGVDFVDDLPDKYIWMTLNQLLFFNRFNNYLNIQARSLIAAIDFS